MLKATVVTTEDELIQIHHLNQQNLKPNLNKETQAKEGFVTWLYSIEFLHKMALSLCLFQKAFYEKV